MRLSLRALTFLTLLVASPWLAPAARAELSILAVGDTTGARTVTPGGYGFVGTATFSDLDLPAFGTTFNPGQTFAQTTVTLNDTLDSTTTIIPGVVSGNASSRLSAAAPGLLDVSLSGIGTCSPSGTPGITDCALWAAASGSTGSYLAGLPSNVYVFIVTAWNCPDAAPDQCTGGFFLYGTDDPTLLPPGVGLPPSVSVPPTVTKKTVPITVTLGDGSGSGKATATAGGYYSAPTPLTSGRVAQVAVGEPIALAKKTCAVAEAAGGDTLATKCLTKAFPKRSTTARLALKLNALGKKLLKQQGSLNLRVLVKTVDRQGHATTTEDVVTLLKR
jgi:hypothetical protein